MWTSTGTVSVLKGLERSKGSEEWNGGEGLKQEIR